MSADVGAVGDFVDQRVRIVDVGRRQIGIVRWGDAFYAISNVCSHQGGPLCRGVLSACLTRRRTGKTSSLISPRHCLHALGTAGSSMFAQDGRFWIPGCAFEPSRYTLPTGVFW